MNERIGLIWPQTAGVWTAGNLYFENLLRSIEIAGQIGDAVIVEPEGGLFAAAHHQDAWVPIVAYRRRPEPRTRYQVLARLLRRQLEIPDRAVDRAVRAAGIGVAFGEVDLRTRFPVPWVGWIPDFQHLHYPEFFSAAEVGERTAIYTRLAQRASLVMLSSHDAYADFARLVPAQASKGRVVPFVSLFDEATLAVDPQGVVSKYSIDRPFVVVPNQWWQHKNHEAAIRAAVALRDRGTHLTWVMTGALADHRCDRHISRLLQLISELGLRDHVVILGALPRGEQVQLMRAAECIVQPSLFEGWSTVVEDARSLGQRIVVSDIPVHREQDPPSALYFDPASHEELADRVESILSGGVGRVPEAEASAAARERARVFGNAFVDVCREAISGSARVG